MDAVNREWTSDMTQHENQYDAAPPMELTVEHSLRDAGFAEDDVEAWVRVVSDSGAVYATDLALDWRACGFRLVDAVDWELRGIAPEDAREWRSSGFTPAQAECIQWAVLLRHKEAGGSIESAVAEERAWRRSGVAPGWACIASGAGLFTPAIAASIESTALRDPALVAALLAMADERGMSFGGAA